MISMLTLFCFSLLFDFSFGFSFPQISLVSCPFVCALSFDLPLDVAFYVRIPLVGPSFLL